MKNHLLSLTLMLIAPGLCLANEPNLTPGSGLVTATNSISPSVCYAVSATPNTTGPYGMAGGGLDMFDFEQAIGYWDDGSPNIKNIYPAAEISYMTTLTEDTQSSSYPNYWLGYWLVQPQLTGYKLDALNDTGKKFYQPDPAKQSSFDQNCGDSFISQYAEGALFTGAMHVRFDTGVQKETYRVAGLNTSQDPLSRLLLLNSLAQQNQFSGTVTIQAYQQGGDPSQLSSVLPQNTKGYYSLSCAISNLGPCISAMQSLDSYAANVLPTQVSFNNPEKGLVPLRYMEMETDPKKTLGL